MKIVKRYNYLGDEIKDTHGYISESKNVYVLRNYIESVCQKEAAQQNIKEAAQKYT